MFSTVLYSCISYMWKVVILAVQECFFLQKMYISIGMTLLSMFFFFLSFFIFSGTVWISKTLDNASFKWDRTLPSEAQHDVFIKYLWGCTEWECRFTFYFYSRAAEMSHSYMDASPFVPLSSRAMPRTLLTSGILLAGKATGCFEGNSSGFL